MIQSEYAASWLAGQCGIEVPEITLLNRQGKVVLLIKRFDRVAINEKCHRRFLISGLTALRLHEIKVLLASYPLLAAFLRRSGESYPADAKQLYRRLVFNILIGNTDDHARNHAFYWDGLVYKLTPAYDICPMLRAGHSARQAMIVGKTGRESTLRNCLSQADQFGLTSSEASAVNELLAETIEAKWDEAAERGALTRKESRLLRQSTVLSPTCFY